MSDRRLIDYLSDIVESAELIAQFIGEHDLGDFIDDKLVQAAVIRHLEVIGEAAKKIMKDYPAYSRI